MLAYYRDERAYLAGDAPRGAVKCLNLTVHASHSKDGRHGFTFILTDAAGKEILCAMPSSQVCGFPHFFLFFSLRDALAAGVREKRNIMPCTNC